MFIILQRLLKMNSDSEQRFDASQVMNFLMLDIFKYQFYGPVRFLVIFRIFKNILLSNDFIITHGNFHFFSEHTRGFKTKVC